MAKTSNLIANIANIEDVPGLSTEHDLQKVIVEWAKRMTGAYPCLALFHAVPNGGHRHVAVAVKMRAEGVKRGVPDLVLPVPKMYDDRLVVGLYLELKRGNNKPTDAQLKFHRAARDAGWRVEVVRTVEEAVAAILDHCRQPYPPIVSSSFHWSCDQYAQSIV